MLLEFKAWNYKSFRDELCFTMKPSRQRGLEYSILKEKIGEKTYRALSSAVIYGPNAAGKTNIIGAMDTFRAIVLRGHINDVDGRQLESPNVAAALLKVIPNCRDGEARPIGFQIQFVDNGRLIDYGFRADVGVFMHDVKRAVLFERLEVNGTEIFCRKKKRLQIGQAGLKTLEKADMLVNEFEANQDSAIRLAQANLKDEELFLENSFKALVSAALVEQINKWLREKFQIIFRSDAIEIRREVTPGRGNIDEKLTEALRVLGMGADKLGFASMDKKDSEGLLCSFIKNPQEGKKGDWKTVTLSAELFESFGTVRFANLYGKLLESFRTGATLVIDEFDASLHPMALMSIINIFHNDEINIHKAQLIFNTHNPIFLNRSLFRRDEIKFVERNEHGYSTHYSLSDFKTKGAVGTRVRNSSDYMHNYFINSYGAIEDIDFSPIFEKAIKG